MEPLQAPFTWFGGKSRAAKLIWDAMGTVDTYIEPFFGSGACLLARPKELIPERVPREIINDADCMVVNFWRATARAPDAVVEAMKVPVYEVEIRATNRTLIAARADLRERLMSSLEYFDAELAGRWCWGQRCWIGGGWADRDAMQVPNQHGSRVLQRGLSDGQLMTHMRALSQRLSHVQALCGDWSRCVASDAMLGLTKETETTKAGGTCGVMLDPPYFDYSDALGTYAVKDRGDKPVAIAAREWAIAHGEDRRLRIVLCGYEGEHTMPAGWTVKTWKAQGGYGNRNKANTNRQRERLWLSPGCLTEQGLFTELASDDATEVCDDDDV